FRQGEACPEGFSNVICFCARTKRRSRSNGTAHAVCNGIYGFFGAPWSTRAEYSGSVESGFEERGGTGRFDGVERRRAVPRDASAGFYWIIQRKPNAYFLADAGFRAIVRRCADFRTRYDSLSDRSVPL